MLLIFKEIARKLLKKGIATFKAGAKGAGVITAIKDINKATTETMTPKQAEEFNKFNFYTMLTVFFGVIFSLITISILLYTGTIGEELFLKLVNRIIALVGFM